MTVLEQRPFSLFDEGGICATDTWAAGVHRVQTVKHRQCCSFCDTFPLSHCLKAQQKTPRQPPRKRITQTALLLRSQHSENLAGVMYGAREDGDGGTGSGPPSETATLRSFLRHERTAVSMALAERLHHSANVTDQKNKEEEQHTALRGQKPARAGPGTQYFSMGDESVAGAGWGVLAVPRPQEWLQRHNEEHTDDVLPFVQILDAPVPQMVDQLVVAFRSLDSPDGRAVYRSAQDLLSIPRWSYGSP